jgi:hypothetical protein
MACALVWLRGPDSLLQAVVGFGLVIPSVAGSHLLMNLRDAYYHPTGETTIGRSDYSRTGIGEVPTFYRGKDVFANEGRHHINGELDTSWALDSTQVWKYDLPLERYFHTDRQTYVGLQVFRISRAPRSSSHYRLYIHFLANTNDSIPRRHAYRKVNEHIYITHRIHSHKHSDRSTQSDSNE